MNRLHLTQAVVLTTPSDMILCSGQPAVDSTGRIVGEGDIRVQMMTAMDNLRTVLHAGGFALADVVRLNLYSTDVDGIGANFDVIASALEEAGCHPANTLLGVARLARPEMLIEIEATAAR
jgi:enamine deaminase RidA (YjgF/YER057c/UK114 family)